MMNIGVFYYLDKNFYCIENSDIVIMYKINMKKFIVHIKRKVLGKYFEIF